MRLGSEVRARCVATGWEGSLRVEVCNHAERLIISTRSPGEPSRTGGLPLEQIAAYGAGDQVLVEDLAAHLVGLGRCEARSRWQELHPGYQVLAEGPVRPTSNGA